MKDNIKDIVGFLIILCVFFAWIFIGLPWWERYRASMWADEMRKAGVVAK